MQFFRKQEWLQQVNVSSEQIRILAHMVHLVHFRQVSERRILQQVWQWENCGSKFRSAIKFVLTGKPQIC